MAKHHIVIKMTDLETGAEQASADLTVISGFGFCSCSCYCSCSLTSVVDPTVAAVATQQAIKTK
jgi:hypothetical protein